MTIPMSGGLYFTQDNPEFSLVYDVGKEVITYKDEKDCMQKIKWFWQILPRQIRFEKQDAKGL